METNVRGDRIDTITTIDKFKKIMNELVRGYPAYLYFGIFEYHFGKVVGEKVVKFLEEDELIKVILPKKAEEQVKYRVTPKGIDFATSMAQLEYSKKVYNFTIIIILLASATLVLTLTQLLIMLFNLAV